MKKIYTPNEPIVAIATALSPAALGIVRASGAGCVERVAKIFSRPRALLDARGNTAVHGWIADGANRVDEILATVFRAPKSFTGEDMVEISCHGGPAVVKAVYDAMARAGFRAAERGEFTFRAFVNGKTDLTRAEAVREIIDSRTIEAEGRAANRLAGALFKEIDGIKKSIVETLASIEVAAEYPEDEETIADSFERADLERARDRLKSLGDSWKGEKLYQEGATVVICGKTNAGKSSLFNVLLKEERAIVSDTAGTTRDWLESWMSFDGVPARLVDTAGLRETADAIEAQGVDAARSLARGADVALYVVDSAAGFDEDDANFLRCADTDVVLVWNKCDLPCADSPREKFDARNFPRRKGEARVSAKSGEGISDLIRAVKNILLSATGGGKGGSATLGSARQKSLVEDALKSVEDALDVSSSGSALDAAAQDLEDALISLGEITGEVAGDDVLDSIFSRFCVGK